MIAYIINDKMEFRKKEEITLSCRKIKEYELKTLIKKNNRYNVLKSRCTTGIKIIHSNIDKITGGSCIGLKKGVICSIKLSFSRNTRATG